MVAKKKTGAEANPRCKVCALDEELRAGVEMVAALSSASWNVAARRIQNTFNLDIGYKAIRTHMMEHDLLPSAKETGVIIDAIRGEDGAPGIISVETMLQTLLVQGMLDLAKGKIRCKTPDELLRVVNVLQQVQDRKNAQALIEDGDIAGFYAAMAAYGTAIRDTVSPAQLVEIVAKANALGAHFDISSAKYEDTVEVDVEDVMQLAVEDHRKLGRGRSREELVEAGELDGAFLDGVSLPD